MQQIIIDPCSERGDVDMSVYCMDGDKDVMRLCELHLEQKVWGQILSTVS